MEGKWKKEDSLYDERMSSRTSPLEDVEERFRGTLVESTHCIRVGKRAATCGVPSFVPAADDTQQKEICQTHIFTAGKVVPEVYG